MLSLGWSSRGGIGTGLLIRDDRFGGGLCLCTFCGIDTTAIFYLCVTYFGCVRIFIVYRTDSSSGLICEVLNAFLEKTTVDATNPDPITLP